MQVNLNNNVNKPQFGMAIKSNENVSRLLKSKIKTSAQVDKLNKIIDSQNENDFVDITLFSDGKYLSANVYPVGRAAQEFQHLGKQFSENAFTRMFGGVVGFIKKAADYADITAGKIAKKTSLNVDRVLMKMETNAEMSARVPDGTDITK